MSIIKTIKKWFSRTRPVHGDLINKPYEPCILYSFNETDRFVFHVDGYRWQHLITRGKGTTQVTVWANKTSNHYTFDEVCDILDSINGEAFSS